jgi:glycosyltransferase involved in cell wall biosynthesis
MMGYVPNYEGIIWFLDNIFPLIRKEIPNIKIYIVGKNPPQKLRKRATGNIIVTGFVKDVRPYVWRSSVYVVPLRMGGGTRLKVLEALAMKKPVVTTSIGCEGIDVTNDETVLKADNPEAFADSVIKLIGRKELRDRLSQNGHELIHSKYRWDAIGNQIEEAYSKLIQNSLVGKTEKKTMVDEQF